jgi:translation initiation factor IF-1
MHDPPVTTTATLGPRRGPTVHQATLPNGKPVIVHLPAALAALASRLGPGIRVRVELTPFDFDHARIAGLAAERDNPAG